MTDGAIRFRGEDVTDWATDARAKAGMFLAFQYPEAIEGVSVIQFLRQAMSARRGEDLSVLEVRLAMIEWMERLGMDPAFGERHLNEGFSGGEKKRNEILQMALLEPRAGRPRRDRLGPRHRRPAGRGRGVQHGARGPARPRRAGGHPLPAHPRGPACPDRVHVLVDGRVVEDGGPELARRIEVDGYDEWRA